MKKIIFSSLFVLGAFAACGSDPCDELKDMCAKCADEVTKSSCNSSQAAADALPLLSDDTCQSLIDSTYSSCK